MHYVYYIVSNSMKVIWFRIFDTSIQPVSVPYHVESELAYSLHKGTQIQNFPYTTLYHMASVTAWLLYKTYTPECALYCVHSRQILLNFSMEVKGIVLFGCMRLIYVPVKGNNTVGSFYEKEHRTDTIYIYSCMFAKLKTDTTQKRIMFPLRT